MTRAHTHDRGPITEALGRPALGDAAIVLRRPGGTPMVIESQPHLDDGTPMPTRYWLVDPELRSRVAQLESSGGVREAEAAVDPGLLRGAHERYARERDALIDPGHEGPRPSGGVGGTRTGVKCLHAHLAWWLVGGDDPVGDWVAERLHLEPRLPRLAAIDCGTNSTRLLVVDPAGNQVDRRMRITRLGAGVDATGKLEGAAIKRTLSVLGEFRLAMDALGVERVRMAATSAARDAANGRELLEAAEAVVGTRAELLSGDEEGRLSYAGAVADLEVRAAPVIVDIGGGSTELAVTVHGEVRAVSMDVGSVRVTERCLRHDPPLPGEIDEARSVVDAALARAFEALPALEGPPRDRILVGLAGTVSTLSMLSQGLSTYAWEKIHHSSLGAATVAHWLAVLSSEDSAARVRRAGMEPGREDVIVGGVLVLDQVMRRLGFTQCTVSEADILDGLAASLVAGVRSATSARG